MDSQKQLLAAEGLTTRFFTSTGVIGAVENIDFHVNEGEIVGIVGESGSGKSVSALSILRLVSMPGRIVSGRVMLRDKNLLSLSESEMRQIRRKQIAMVFQDPSNFLNPVLTIGQQIEEAIAESGISKRELRANAIEAIRSVQIPNPERVIDYYPFQMSGGMQQRAVIAAAVARRPSLIIADEPTTALDATVQYQILRLLAELQATAKTAIILISHDLSVIASLCARVYTMYAAQVVESGPTELVYQRPAHPYTQALLGATLDPLEQKDELAVLEGGIPDLSAPPAGCRFHQRCPRAMTICAQEEPPMFAVADGHSAKCWLHKDKLPEAAA